MDPTQRVRDYQRNNLGVACPICGVIIADHRFQNTFHDIIDICIIAFDCGRGLILATWTLHSGSGIILRSEII